MKEEYKSKYEKFGVLPIGIVKSNVSSVHPSSEASFPSPTLKTLDFTIHIGSTPNFLYFDLYLNIVYAKHYVYFTKM